MEQWNLTATAILLSLSSAIAVPTPSVAQTPNQPIFPFNAPAGYALISASKLDASGTPLLYGAPSISANWRVAQWHDPVDLPPFNGSSSSTSTVNGYAGVTIAQDRGNGPAITFSGSGKWLACQTASGYANEFDLLAAPTTQLSSSYQPATNQRYQQVSSFPSLAQLSALDTAGYYTLNYPYAVTGVSPCPVDQANTSVNLVLTNTFATPAQVFWYNIHLSFICPTSSTQYQFCRTNVVRPTQNWFWRGVVTGSANHIVLNYGLNDTTLTYGFLPIEDNATHYLTLHILPALLKALSVAGSSGMDIDPSHWRLSGYQVGQALWGKTYVSSTFQGFNPSWTMR